MRLRDYEWHLHDEVLAPLGVMAALSLGIVITGVIVHVAGEPLESNIQGGGTLLVVVNLLCVIGGVVLASECRRRPWMALVGTTVDVKTPMMPQHRIDRAADPVWRWMWDSGIRDNRVQFDGRKLTFMRRKDAVLYKLAWGGNEVA